MIRNWRFFLIIIPLIFFHCASNPRVVIVTNMGEIEIELNRDEAPKHAENFLKLVNDGLYSGTTFHRIVPGFVIQGGDPNSKDMNPDNDGTGGTGYLIDAEIKLSHKKGSVAAARFPDQVNPERKSNGSQFYICLQELPQLDQGGYTVFGHVVRGMDTVEKIARVKTGAMDRPVRRVVMERVYEN